MIRLVRFRRNRLHMGRRWGVVVIMGEGMFSIMITDGSIGVQGEYAPLEAEVGCGSLHTGEDGLEVLR